MRGKMNRYEKHILLKEIGKKGQEKLLSSRVAIIGCGGLGSVIATNLARAGVGEIRIVDRDYVEIDNLQRQILFDEEDAEKRVPKAVSAVEKLRKVNSEINLIPIVEDVSPLNIEKIIKDVDAVADGTDNMETRFLINDACIKYSIPWVYGAVIGTEGMTMNIFPGKTACLRCFIKNIPSPGILPTCETAGILNTAVNVIASIQSTELIKILTGKKFRREAIHFDVWHGIFTPIKVKKLSSCISCGRKIFEFLDGKYTKYTDSTVLCGRKAVQINPNLEKEISFEVLYEKLKDIGNVEFNEYMLRFHKDKYEFIVFKNGRTIIKGTGDKNRAKSLYARYIGF
ncbi:MAG TPA: hypothetical protein ENI33_00100 [Thermoplasmatales archaeon]|nr:hypothetical protein [Thermoplasmatales archaeon]